MNLKNLPTPSIIEELNFEAIKSDLLEFIKTYLPDYVPLESDTYMPLIEAIAYREMLLRARVNNSILELLLPHATGNNLDNVVAIYGIERLAGAKPTTELEFTLSLAQTSDVTIPAGTILRDNNANIAELKDSVIIKKGELKASGVSILNETIKESDIKCELIQTPLPFVVNAKQLTNFMGGSDKEDDESLRLRAILSLDRFSTAGSKGGYEYYALSSNAKIEEAKALNNGAGEVKVIIKVSDDDASVVSDVLKTLSSEKVRPLTDFVEVKLAIKQSLTIKATLELIDMLRQDEIYKKILSSTRRFSLDEDVNLSYIYKVLHQEGVYRVSLGIPASNIIMDKESFVEITTWDLTFIEAVI
ncbi:MAG: baseplate J/gp47 family protein [Campylobacteraceae bacterium]